jgi:hypothetical protein
MNAFGFAGILLFYAAMLFVSAASFLEGPIRAAKARGEDFQDPAWVRVVVPLIMLLALGAIAAFIVGVVQGIAGTL